MKTDRRPYAYLIRLGLASASLVTLSACVVAPGTYRPVAAGPGPVVVSPEIVVTMAPPAPYVEVIPHRINPSHVWLPGFWAWQGGRHHWVGGRWDAPPAGRRDWENHRWIPVPGRGWRFESGRWH